MPYHIKRKYYKQLAEHGFENYPKSFYKRTDNIVCMVRKSTGEHITYQDKISYIERDIMGKTWVNIPSFELVEINTPPDLPSEWWRKE